MDSLTQIALGASVMGACTGRILGRKSILIGAVIATLPDMDVIINYGDAVSNFTYHRGFSHSILFSILMTLPICWLLTKIKQFKLTSLSPPLIMGVFLTLVTHPLLDAMTIYGTQLFWPLSIPPLGLGSIFIIDPVYTLPLLLAMIVFLCRPQNIKIFYVGLGLSSLYLIWTVSAQFMITQEVKAQIPQTKNQFVLIQPTPFNTLLWRILVVEDDGYKVAYHSVFDKNSDFDFKSYESDKSRLDPIAKAYAVERLIWFTKGYYSVTENDGRIYITDLRMGIEPANYVYSFLVGRRDGTGQIVDVPNRAALQERGLNRLSKIWARIWDQTQQL